jgi:ribosome-associated toxin RatA of RatAB toxin-antitoxin module
MRRHLAQDSMVAVVVKEVSRTAIVGCPAALLYTLVNQIDRYPKWFAWCKSSAIIEQNADRMLGQMTVSFAGIEVAFSTENKLIADRQIDMQLKDGPFKTLQGTWQFSALGQSGCRVSLTLAFDLGSSVLSSVLSPAVSAWADKMVDDFVRVARQTLAGELPL